MNLTPKQQAVLQAIEDHIQQTKRPPSYADLQKKLNYGSTASIWRFVQELQKKGFLCETKGQWHSLCPIQKSTHIENKIPEGCISVDIIGHIIRDKAPMLSLKSSPLLLPSDLVRHTSGCYGLILDDASYIDLHLLPHDLIIVDPRSEIQAGELVIASNEETLIGHVFEEGNLLQFRSSPYSIKSHHEHIRRVKIDDIHIWGIIIASIRSPHIFHE